MYLIKELPRAAGLDERYGLAKAMLKGLANEWPENRRLERARGFCTKILEAYWTYQTQALGSNWLVKRSPFTGYQFSKAELGLADEIGALLSEFDTRHAGYYVGTLYTLMLPTDIRANLGAFYTPPAVVERLMDLAEHSGVDFGTANVIDPACGGGAFLAPVAQRMLAQESKASPEVMLRRIAGRLKGVEIDPFAAWMSEVLLEVSLLPLCVEAEVRLPRVVKVADSLQLNPGASDGFDLVIGNPPYGRAKIGAEVRKKYSESIYGHANLYGLFLDLATQLTKDGGSVAFVTPTSLLGGQYFKALRAVLTDRVCAAAIDFITDREGVFDDVLQETMLSVFVKKRPKSKARVSRMIVGAASESSIEFCGEHELCQDGAPWFLPRAADQLKLVSALQKMPARLGDFGYEVSTGQLVWNRHKKQLKTEKSEHTLPLIWAESITAEGFEFSAKRKNHVPYIALKRDQEFLVTSKECVLVQRTTSKEQERRLIGAILPESFLRRHKGAVIENHLNIVSAKHGPPLITTETLVCLLNSEAADRAFRCISGSVAVSAYELNSLPLPDLDSMFELEGHVKAKRSKAYLEKLIASFYENTK